MTTQPFKGRTVLITGASTGIGRAYAAAGADRVLAARRLPLEEEAAREAESLGVKALPVRCAVTQGEDVERLVRASLRGRRDTVLTLPGRFMVLANRLAPGLFDRVALRMANPAPKKDA